MEHYFEKGELVILKATSESLWKKWKVFGIDTQNISILEPKPDVALFQQTGIISLMQQAPPTKAGMASPLRLLEYQVKP